MTIATPITPPPLPPPRINAKARPTLRHAEGPEGDLRVLATAGMSHTLVHPPDAWNLYVHDTGVLDQYLDVWNTFRTPLQASLFPYQGASLSPDLVFTTSESIADLSSSLNTFIHTGTAGFPVYSPLDWTRVFQSVNVDPLTTHEAVRSEYQPSRDSALAEIRRRLDRVRASYSPRSPREIVLELGEDVGVGQLVTARALSVTPTAVRKWRRGEPARPEHRDGLTRLAAMFRLLSQLGLHDPAGWVDIPVSTESTLTPLDLFVFGRADLAVLLGSGLADPEEALNLFSPDWRTSHTPDAFYEVVTLRDGSRSVVPRREAAI